MAGFFYNLGRKVGPKVRKGKWVWQSLTGNEADMIAAENDVGKDLALEVRLQVPVVKDSKVQGPLDEIGIRLKKRIVNKLRRFSFEVVAQGEPNAFALPGGYIFVTVSLLDLCKWDVDETAFILAHEMAHVVKGHAIERIVTDSAVNVASRTMPVRGAISGWIKRVGIKCIQSAYSQGRELQADDFAVRLTSAAGFDPKAGVRLFQRLAEAGKDPSGLGQYFASHPPFTDRIMEIRRLTGKKAKRK